MDTRLFNAMIGMAELEGRITRLERKTRILTWLVAANVAFSLTVLALCWFTGQ